MTYPVEVGKAYDFSVYPSTVIPGDYTNVTVLAILDADSARSIVDIDALHAAVYPYLPVGTLDDANAYYYVKVQLSNGVKTALGITWINQSTITPRVSTKIHVLIDNAATTDVERVRQCLMMNGFNHLIVSLNPIPST